MHIPVYNIVAKTYHGYWGILRDTRGIPLPRTGLPSKYVYVKWLAKLRLTKEAQQRRRRSTRETRGGRRSPAGCVTSGKRGREAREDGRAGQCRLRGLARAPLKAPCRGRPGPLPLRPRRVPPRKRRRCRLAAPRRGRQESSRAPATGRPQLHLPQEKERERAHYPILHRWYQA